VIRQRITLRTPLLAHLVRALTVVLGVALLWYGLMTVLLAVKVSPDTVNSLSAYRSLYADAVGLTGGDFTTGVRLLGGFAGVIAFLLFIYLALQELPRPHLARGDVDLDQHERGSTIVRPRAIERVAESAARGNSAVTAAAGRLGDRELTVNIGLRRASVVAETMRDVQSRVGYALDRHELPDLPINVILTDYERRTRRELS
jgi:hypothetical protein